MALLWLRFALGCYFVGLIYAFFALSRTSDLFSRIALQAASLGMVFHFVSLVELFLAGHVVWASVHNSESLLAFLSMSFFMGIYAIYKTTSPGVVVFPIVFFLTFVAAVGGIRRGLAGMSPNRPIDQLAELYSGVAKHLTGPAITGTEEIATALTGDPAIARTLNEAAAADIVVLGLGPVAGPVALLEQGDGRHDLARGAIAALERVVLDEGVLHRVELAALR